MHGFELTIPPSPAWTDLTRDLVAIGVSPLDLEMDRFHDLLVLTDLVITGLLGRQGATGVRVTLSVTDRVLTMTCEAHGAVDSADPVSDFALSVLTEDHWHSITDDGVATGFRLNG